MSQTISVILSQGQSQHPAKRQLEEDLVAGLLMEPGIDLTVIPHLYDLTPEGTGILALQGVGGDMIVLSWLYSRAAHWVLDRSGIRGHAGNILLTRAGEDEVDDDEVRAAESAADGDGRQQIDAQREIPDRRIYCLDLGARDAAAPFIAEIKRIVNEAGTNTVDLMSWLGGTPRPEQRDRFVRPANNTALGKTGSQQTQSETDTKAKTNTKTNTETDTEAAGRDKPPAPQRVAEQPARRWYPVIDYSRCTNCMECIDFCLFGVYGIDRAETILVEQPDNCRKGCPACSRVCPENAIIFPQHKTPAIAGAPVAVGGLKIDLSKLFGAPDGSQSAEDIAARERDEQLILAGRNAVSVAAGIPKRQQHKPPEAQDELDDLLDELDELDL